jgi:hypothetical protein
MKLGGFAAPFKIKMMMMQSGLAQRGSGTCGRMVVRAVALVVWMSMTLPLIGGGQARAEAHPVRERRIAMSSQVRGAKAHGITAASRSAGMHNAHHASSRAAGKSRQTDHVVAEHQAKSKAGVHAKGRRRKRREPAQDNLPTLHRVSARRRGAAAARRNVSAREMARDSRQNSAVASSGSASGIYSSGESHPDQDVNVATAQTAPVMAMVEPAQNTPAPMQRAAPSDLVGAPFVAAGRMAPTADPRQNSSVRGASQQELTAEVEQPVVLLGRYRNGRLIVPPPLKGSHDILVHQNVMADDEGLQRVQDDDDLRRMRATRQLIDLSESAGLHVNPELGIDRRCARPWAVHFAENLSRAYYARFHQPLQVNSAVRTVAFQMRLRRVNGNAAGIDGESASPHLTGEALDFGKHGMSVEEIAWMRLYLPPLMQSGKLDVEEEFQQACFHISVYRTYQSGSRRRRSDVVAQLHEPRVTRVAQHSTQDQ